MTPQQLLGLGLRFAAIWVLMLPLQLVAVTLAMFDFLHEPRPVLWLALSFVPGLLGIFLWLFPMLCANKLLPDNGESGNMATVRDVTAALGVLVGAFAVINAAPYIFSAASMALGAPDVDLPPEIYETLFGAKFTVSMVQNALGLVLILMPRFVAGLIFRDHTAMRASY